MHVGSIHDIRLSFLLPYFSQGSLLRLQAQVEGDAHIRIGLQLQVRKYLLLLVAWLHLCATFRMCQLTTSDPMWRRSTN
jgi:hypothetical protein